MKLHIKTWKTGMFAVAVLLATITSVFAMPGAASAAGCRTTDVGMNNGYPNTTNQWASFNSSGSVSHWYTDPIKSPSWATSCKDVNINYVNVPGDTWSDRRECVYFRAVDHYNGRTSGWKLICPGEGWRVILSNVYGHTYHVEAVPYASSNYRPYYTIMD